MKKKQELLSTLHSMSIWGFTRKIKEEKRCLSKSRKMRERSASRKKPPREEQASLKLKLRKWLRRKLRELWKKRLQRRQDLRNKIMFQMLLTRMVVMMRRQRMIRTSLISRCHFQATEVSQTLTNGHRHLRRLQSMYPYQIAQKPDNLMWRLWARSCRLELRVSLARLLMESFLRR